MREKGRRKEEGEEGTFLVDQEIWHQRGSQETGSSLGGLAFEARAHPSRETSPGFPFSQPQPRAACTTCMLGTVHEQRAEPAFTGRATPSPPHSSQQGESSGSRLPHEGKAPSGQGCLLQTEEGLLS